METILLIAIPVAVVITIVIIRVNDKVKSLADPEKRITHTL